jgi:RNA polymerase sigma-70 factor (ECF subfamily)
VKVQYQDADGQFMELDVTEAVGQFYLNALEEEKRSERKETRRHTSLSAFAWEDSDFFIDEHDRLPVVTERVSIAQAVSRLSKEQQRLVRQVYYEELSLTAIAKSEGVSHAAIIDRLRRIHKKLKIILR